MRTIDYRMLFETAAVGIVVQDVHGKIIGANPAAERILRLTIGREEHASVDAYWHTIREDGAPFSRENHPAMIALREGVAVRNVIMGVSDPAQARTTWLRVNATPIFQQGATTPHQVHTTLEDVTDYIEAERSQRSINAALHEQQVQAELARHDALRQLLMDTAMQFINIPIDRIDQGIVEVLSSVGQFNQADRAYIFDYDFGRGLMHNTYEWCAPGIEPQIENLQNGLLEDFADWVNVHLQKRPVHIPDVFALHEENPLRAVLEMQEIKSLITIPLTEQDECLGFIGFDAVRQHRDWSETDVALLKLLAELIVNAKRRLRHETMLKQTAEELRVSEKRLNNAQRIARLGAWEYDIRTGKVNWSEEVFRIVGMAATSQAPDFQAIVAALHEEDRAGFEQAVMRAIEYGEPYELELRVHHPEGGLVYALGRGEIEFGANQKPIRLVGSVLDITERKESELALQNALKREKELSELKSRFVAMASHEFRNPLAAILAASETLLAYGDQLDRKQMLRRIEKIRERVTHLQAVINDMLQLARIEAGTLKFTPETTTLDDFCATIIEDYRDQPELHRRMQYRRHDTPLPVKIDHRLLRQAIENVLDNAGKYAAAASDIEIELMQEGTMAIVSVRDQGIGIPCESLARLFEPFHRAPNAATIPGTGLGMPITQKIVEMHGGNIRVKSKVNVGTLVEIRLPIAQNA